MNSFVTTLEKAVKKNNSLLCVGLDTTFEKLPKHLLDKSDPVYSFNREIIDATADFVACYKPNIAYYEAMGTDGLKSLKKTVDYIHDKYPGIPVLVDAKRADIAATSEQYAKSLLGCYNFDACTVNPYLGFDSLEPFLRDKTKGIVILCRTSNTGAIEFQDLKVKNMKLYEYVARTVVRWDRTYGNCLMVVGATWPKQMKSVRAIAKKMWFLVPGIGTQGGDLEMTLQYGLRKDRSGLLITFSRNIIYAGKDEKFAEAARKEAGKMRDLINRYRATG